MEMDVLNGQSSSSPSAFQPHLIERGSGIGIGIGTCCCGLKGIGRGIGYGLMCRIEMYELACARVEPNGQNVFPFFAV